jgi:hypothetical protein
MRDSQRDEPFPIYKRASSDTMNRRNFILTLVGAAAVAGLPLPKLAPLNLRDRFRQSRFAQEKDYDRFLQSLEVTVQNILQCNQTTYSGINIHPVEELGGFRFVQLWTKKWEQPFSWYHPV